MGFLVFVLLCIVGFWFFIQIEIEVRQESLKKEKKDRLKKERESYLQGNFLSEHDKKLMKDLDCYITFYFSGKYTPIERLKEKNG